ncbi:MAG: AmmeMemoRadiSam system protein A [Acidobacteria bacterium]|nr:AmmeMemoRadiSam system protein A [Acidobacteriota bacterium]
MAGNKKINGSIEGFATSGEITHDWTTSVSYLAVLFTDPPLSPATEHTCPADPAPSFALSDEEKETLLRLARHTLTAYLATGKMPEFDSERFKLTPSLCEQCGAFVTLNKRHQLRGCIGYVVAVKPLYVAVQEMVINAAVRDPRFPPVTAAELSEIKMEISVLSPLEPCADPNHVTVGRHGLVIQKDGRSGLLLPQVPVEWGWDRTQFLRQVCAKAGLPSEAYKEQDAVLYVFTAEVFHEPE